ncbi:metallophosphoesterase [Paenibacillus sp. CF095]|jgi:hypothetical protein
MKIAIITDIHGNYPALSAVFSDIVSRGKKNINNALPYEEWRKRNNR